MPLFLKKLGISEEEDKNWRHQHHKRSPRPHTELLKRLGITAKEDWEWHQKQSGQKPKSKKTKAL